MHKNFSTSTKQQAILIKITQTSSSRPTQDQPSYIMMAAFWLLGKKPCRREALHVVQNVYEIPTECHSQTEQHRIERDREFMDVVRLPALPAMWVVQYRFSLRWYSACTPRTSLVYAGHPYCSWSPDNDARIVWTCGGLDDDRDRTTDSGVW